METHAFQNFDAAPNRKVQDRAAQLQTYRHKLEHYDDQTLLEILSHTTGSFHLAARLLLEERGHPLPPLPPPHISPADAP